MKKKNRVYVVEAWRPVGQKGKKLKYGWIVYSPCVDYRAARMAMADERDQPGNTWKYRVTKYVAAR